MRYCPKYVEIWTFGSKSQFLAHISRFLWTHCIFLKTDWCVETVSPSRSKRVPWTPKTERNYFWPLKGPCWTYFGIFQWRFRHKTPLNNTDSLIFVSINRIHLRFSNFPTFSIFNPPYWPRLSRGAGKFQAEVGKSGGRSKQSQLWQR